MISQARLKNFQAHKDLTVDFTPGVNVILGEGDKGKTSIVRALSWIAGQKKYKDIIHHGENECSVSIKLDGHNITRLHADKRNEIFLDGATFQKIGRDGCQEADKVLNLSGINFQLQHDAPFFLSLTPGQAANMLNEVANLSHIDELLNSMRKDLRQTVDKIDEWQKEVDAQTVKLQGFSGLDCIEKDAENLNKLDEKLLALGSTTSDIAKELSAYRCVKVPAKLSINICKMEMEIGLLGKHKTQIENISASLESYYDAKICPQIPPLPFARYDKAVYIASVVDKLSKVLSEYHSATWEDDELNQAVAERDANAPKICPTCGQAILKQGV